jgi:hypothetical protein
MHECTQSVDRTIYDRRAGGRAILLHKLSAAISICPVDLTLCMLRIGRTCRRRAASGRPLLATRMYRMCMYVCMYVVITNFAKGESGGALIGDRRGSIAIRFSILPRTRAIKRATSSGPFQGDTQTAEGRPGSCRQCCARTSLAITACCGVVPLLLARPA